MPRLFTYQRYDSEFWFRFGQYGPGFSFTDHRIHRMLFSERNGYRKALHIGPYCIKYLSRWRTNA
jgi:hypothetical protein